MTIDHGFSESVEDRRERVWKHKDGMPLQGTLFSRVTSATGDSERVKVETSAGSKVSSFAYPFASRTGWIRGQPEPTTTMVSVIGGDTYDLQPIAYFDPAKSTAASVYRRVADQIRNDPTGEINGSVTPYRTLSPGEVDQASGYSQTYMGMSDVHQSRGGLSHWTLSSTEARLESALHSVKGHAHQLGNTLSDETRFGTVRRASAGTATQQGLITSPGASTHNQGPVFAKEYSQVLSWFGAPDKLLDHRQGVVVDDDGSFATSSQTSQQLRARMQWYSQNGVTKKEIDVSGNVLFSTSQDATEGVVANIPQGNMLLTTGREVQVQAEGNIEVATQQQMAMAADRGFQLTTPQKADFRADSGFGISSNGVININTPAVLGVTVGEREADKYPALVAHPDYIAGLNQYYSAQSGFSGSLAAYGNMASQAWASIGPLCMVLDPSGVIMGLCLAASQAAAVISSQAPQVQTAVGQLLPRISQMPAGFMSRKLSSE